MQPLVVLVRLVVKQLAPKVLLRVASARLDCMKLPKEVSVHLAKQACIVAVLIKLHYV